MPNSKPGLMGDHHRAFAIKHLNLARHQAHRFARRHDIPFEDLIGVAYEGLCKAALGFDASKGFMPSSYVVPKVKGELLHYVRDFGYGLRISCALKELWMRGRRQLPLGYGDAEIASQLKVSLDRWLECRLACEFAPIPLDQAQLE
ncbi:sigma factor [Cyanobium sp. HWJ4-Hawea]|uniref:sigma factor n=1 Tax=Cyanobium sp. HWJ4-Hawea TaxID=2823713 RepID=UPI0020CF9989|nr:sigma factor [Cyanobium sp. HWJ4-Hawea]